MFAKLTKMAALRGADRVLESCAKINATIKTELNILQALIRERLSVEHAVIDAETAAALGESADTAGARGRSEQVLRSIDRQVGILAGLRSRLAAMAGEMERERQAVSAALPEHIERVKSDFASKWTRGVATYSALLGERQALETLVGKLELAEPKATATELVPSISAPWQALDQLVAALGEVAAWSRSALWPEVDAMGPRSGSPFDPAKVYVLTQPLNGLGAGEPVIEASFEPGALAHFVAIGYAVPAGLSDWKSLLETGFQASRKANMEAEESARLRFEAEERRVNPRLAVTAAEQSPDKDRQRAARQMFDFPPEKVGRVVV